MIDVDPRNGGVKSWRSARATYGKLPCACTAETGGGGRHFFFKAPKRKIKTTHGKAFGPGVDVQGEGAFVVAPPSIHKSGKRYEWVEGRDLSVGPTELPSTYRKYLSELPAKANGQPTGQKDQTVTEGERNIKLTSLGGKLVASGVSSQAMSAALLAENETFHPPLSPSEVEKIATSLARYSAQESGDEAERIARAALSDLFESDGHLTLVHASDGQFWHFDRTHWRPASPKWLLGVVLRFVQAWPGRKTTNTTSLLRQVITLLEALVATRDDLLRFNAPPPPVINCENGELWLDDRGETQLKPHSAASYLRTCLSVAYDPQASCPAFDRAIAEIFANAPDPKTVVRFWNELAGYAIQPARTIPLVVICKGAGSNGKTALMETLVRLIGSDLVAAMPVEDLDKSRFTVGGLLGKQLFLDDDVKSGTKLPDGNLKRLSEAKTVTGEHKFGRQFTFTVRTLPVLLCNNPPSLGDLSYGMRRRLIVVPFDRTFLPKEADKTLFPRIWENEMPGVLNRCLQGLSRVVQRGWQLSNPEALRDAKDEWLLEANPLPAFIVECCQTNGNGFVEDLYRAFVEWTKERGMTLTQQRTSFDRNLESCGFKFGTKGNRGKRVIGLQLKSR